METKFNFKSAICTSRSQSERLLSLGLKKETADCHWAYHSVTATRYVVAHPCDGVGECIPAWSLHRMLSLLPRSICTGRNYYDIVIVQNEFVRLADDLGDTYKYFDKENLYEGLIDCIEWLIKEGYFNKEYLNGSND